MWSIERAPTCKARLQKGTHTHTHGCPCTHTHPHKEPRAQSLQGTIIAQAGGAIKPAQAGTIADHNPGCTAGTNEHHNQGGTGRANHKYTSSQRTEAEQRQPAHTACA